MPGSPIFPCSAIPVTAGLVFPRIHVCAGANFKRIDGLGVTDATTLTSDAIWELVFQMPPTSLPTGTCKLHIVSQASAIIGDLKFNPKWASCAAGEDPSALTLNAEGTNTISWGTGDTDKEKESKVILDADTPVAGERIIMQLTFENTGTDLAVASTHRASIIWE